MLSGNFDIIATMTKLLLLIASVLSLLLLNSFDATQKSIATPLSEQKETTEVAVATTTFKTIPSEKIATSTQTTKPPRTPEKVPAQVKPPVKETLVASQNTTTLPSETAQQLEIVEFDEINKKVRGALVNILCSANGNTLNPLSGSGVLISEKGVILTNAHIGQYFLLPEYIDCVIRVGSPAHPEYKAKLIYISNEWMIENAVQINQPNPLGTGENDYALLLITERIASPDPLPQFSSLSLFLGSVGPNEYILAGSYPAGFLGGSAILQNLYAVSSVARVKEVFTFEANTADLISIGGTVVSQKGSSGGAAVNKDGLLAGLIVTATDADKTADRDLRAITLNHIDRSLSNETGTNLLSLLAKDLVVEQQKFESDLAPNHKQKLIDILEN